MAAALNEAQIEALDLIERDGLVHMCGPVSFRTAQSLARMGLVKLHVEEAFVRVWDHKTRTHRDEISRTYWEARLVRA